VLPGHIPELPLKRPQSTCFQTHQLVPNPTFSLPSAHSPALQSVWARGLSPSQCRRGAGRGGGGVSDFVSAPCAKQSPSSSLCWPPTSSATARRGPFACKRVPVPAVTQRHGAALLTLQPHRYLCRMTGGFSSSPGAEHLSSSSIPVWSP